MPPNLSNLRSNNFSLRLGDRAPIFLPISVANVFIPGDTGEQRNSAKSDIPTELLIRVIDLSGLPSISGRAKTGPRGDGHESSVNLNCRISTIDHVGRV